MDPKPPFPLTYKYRGGLRSDPALFHTNHYHLTYVLSTADRQAMSELLQDWNLNQVAHLQWVW